MPEFLFLCFLDIYIYNCSCGCCGFFWVDQEKKKKIKSSFLRDIRGKKDGEEKSFPCLVLFISAGMEQSGFRGCLDGGLWHRCSSRGVAKSVQVPNAAQCSKSSWRDARPPCRVRGLHALQNPSSEKAVQIGGTAKEKNEELNFFIILSKYPSTALWHSELLVNTSILTAASFRGDGVCNGRTKTYRWAQSGSTVFKRPVLIRTQQESKQANNLNEFSYCDA